MIERTKALIGIGVAATLMAMVGACAMTQSDLGSRDAAQAMPDSPGAGPYPAIKEVTARLPRHVVYRPSDLAARGDRKLGVYVWGNGGCKAEGTSARQHLLDIASFGYVAIAPGEIRSGPGVSLPAPRSELADGSFPPIETTPEDVLAGLDWILAENERTGSPYYRRIDTSAIAAGGHSCGGLQAIKVSVDPRIATTVIYNSGILNADVPNPIRGLSAEKSELTRYHAPVLYVLGGPTDIAYQNGMDDFRRIEHVPVAVASLDVGHGGTFAQPNGGDAAEVTVKWLEWQLRGDTEAARWFMGSDCVLCESPDWDFSKKGF